MASKVLFFLLALAMAATMAFGSTSWEVCSKRANYKVKINDVLVRPDPVVSGQDVTFVVPATTGVPLDSGKVIITVLFHGIPVHRESDDLCSKTSCPIAAGDFELTASQPLPSITPPGSYKIKLQVVQGSKQLACANIRFEIVGHLTAVYSH